MTKTTKTIKNGTTVICQMGGSHFMFGQVVDTINDKWGTHYDIRVLFITNENVLRPISMISTISDEDMKGIGWKLANTEDIRIANLYMN